MLLLNQTCKQCLCELFDTLNSLFGGSLFAAGRRDALDAYVAWRHPRSQLMGRHQEVGYVCSVPKRDLKYSLSEYTLVVSSGLRKFNSQEGSTVGDVKLVADQ